MAFFKKKPDPVSDRSRALNAEIAALEAKIKKLNQQLEPNQTPRIRSTAYPSGATVTPAAKTPANGGEPIFEEIPQNPLTTGTETRATPEHFNEMGMRKYDVLALWARFKGHFGGQPLANQKLVSYLAAGSVHGLRPLRYEKRVQRNRFLFVVAVFILVLFGIFYGVMRHN